MSRLLRAAAAGLVGTSWMTAAQELAASGADDDGEPSRNDAPAPAQVARKSLPFGIYDPPWSYDAKTLARDVGYHLAFGVGAVTAAQALRRPQ